MSRLIAGIYRLAKSLKAMPENIYTVFKYPVLITLFALNVSVAIPLAIFGITVYGLPSLGLLVLAESPIIFLVVKEALREMKLLPMSETWETSPEKWNQALRDFMDMIHGENGENQRQ